MVWVVVASDSAGSAAGFAVYGARDRRYTLHQLTEAGFDTYGSKDETLDELNRLAADFAKGDHEIPALAVLRFRTADTHFEADFSYEPWEVGIAAENRRRVPHLAQMWAKHFVEAGEDSARWRPPQGYSLS